MSDLFVAEPIEEPPRRTNWAFWIFALVILAFVVLGLVLAARLGYFEDHRISETSPAARVFSSEQRFADVHRAFSEPFNDLTQADVVSISKAIDRIMKTEENGEDIYERIDVTGFLRQLKASGEFPSIGFSDRSVIRRDFMHVTNGPQVFENFQIVSIQKLDANQVIAYLYAWDDFDRVRELRWWMTRKDEEWQVANWESIRNGMSEAEEYAILCENQRSMGISDYYSSMDAVDSFLRVVEDGDEDRARKILNDIQQLGCHPKLFDQRQLRIGFLWTHIWDLKRAAAAFAAIKQPERVPGAYFGQAFCAFESADYESAIKWSDKCLEVMGPSPNCVRMRAVSLESLQRNQEALEDYKRLAELLPDDAQAKAAIVRLVGTLPIETIESMALEFDDRESLGIGLIDSAYASRDVSKIKIGQMLLNESDSYPELDVYVEGLQRSFDYDYEVAIAKFREAASRSSDPERIERYRNRWMALLCEMARQLECYESADDKAAAFSFLVEEYDAEDWYFSPEQLLEIVDRHAQVAPDEPWIEYYRGLALHDLSRIDEAINAFQEGRRRHPDAEGGYIAGSCEYYVNSLLVQQGKWKQAYDESVDKEATFKLLAKFLANEKQVYDLKALHEQFSKSHPGNSNAAYFGCRIKMLEGKYNEALVELSRQKSADSENRGTLQRAISECLIETENWRNFATNAETEPEEIRSLWNEFQLRGEFERLPDLRDTLVAKRHAKLRRDFTMRLAQAGENDESLLRCYESLTEEEQPASRRQAVSAALRLDRNELARELSQDIIEDSEDHFPACLVAINSGDALGLKQSLEKLEYGYQLGRLLSDPLARPLWVRPEFGQIRNELVPPMPLQLSDFSIYLLYSRKPKMPIVELRKLLDSFSESEVKLSKLNGLTPGQQASAIIGAFGDSRFVLSQQKRLELDAGLSPGKAIEECMSSHKYTLAANIWGGKSERESFSKVFQVAQMLTTDDCVGVYCPQLSKLVVDPQTQMAKVNPLDRRTFSPGADWMWLVAKSEPDEVPAWQRTNTAIQRAKQPFTEASRIRVVTNVGPVKIDQWLKPIGYTSKGDESWIECEFTEDPQLFPIFKEGSRVRVYPYQVHEWK